jgi:hypothetical protein
MYFSGYGKERMREGSSRWLHELEYTGLISPEKKPHNFPMFNFLLLSINNILSMKFLRTGEALPRTMT